jgi:FHA domain
MVFDDPTISNVHLKVYVIGFDEEDSVSPLVYAEDLSSNGTYWNGTFIGRANGAFLLSHGDEIRLSSTITLLFKSVLGSAEEAELEGIPMRDLEVGLGCLSGDWMVLTYSVGIETLLRRTQAPLGYRRIWPSSSGRERRLSSTSRLQSDTFV